MPKARSILKRMRVVKSTRTITRTMEMISTARFKKTHGRVVAARPYTDRLTRVVAEMVEALAGQGIRHGLMDTDPGVKDHVLMVLTANRGLCGSYNAGNLRLAMGQIAGMRQAGRNVLLHVVGKRGIAFFRFRHMPIAGGYTQFDYQPGFAGVSAMADEFMAQYMDKKIGGLSVVYTRFVSAGMQRPTVARILPLSVSKREALKGEARVEGVSPSRPAGVPPAVSGEDGRSREGKMPSRRAGETPATQTPATLRQAPRSQPLYDFVPGPREVLSRLLPATVKLGLYQAFLDAAVSEQIARMTSMRAATENADEMIHALTIRYNRTRQSQITTELAEIMGGRISLEQG